MGGWWFSNSTLQNTHIHVHKSFYPLHTHVTTYIYTYIMAYRTLRTKQGYPLTRDNTKSWNCNNWFEYTYTHICYVTLRYINGERTEHLYLLRSCWFNDFFFFFLFFSKCYFHFLFHPRIIDLFALNSTNMQKKKRINIFLHFSTRKLVQTFSTVP